jgi:hypothetical protein
MNLNRRSFITLLGAAPAARFVRTEKAPPVDAECACSARGVLFFIDSKGVSRCIRCDGKYTGEKRGLELCIEQGVS